MQPFYLGIDGGGSGARARLVDAAGNRLGEGTAGPANIGRDVDAAIAALDLAARRAIAAAGLADGDRQRISAVVGAAGAAVDGAVARVMAAPFGFAHLKIVTDAEIALAGAFAAGDGGIVILGTGSQAFGRVGERRVRFGGWGVALSDDGSGAVLGQQAARRALAALEGLAAASPLTLAIAERLGGSPTALAHWARAARPADWAGLAPLVFDQAGADDPVALALVDAARRDVEALVARLVTEGIGRVVLVGGLAARYRPLLSPAIARLVVEAEGDALDGALRLAREGETS